MTINSIQANSLNNQSLDATIINAALGNKTQQQTPPTDKATLGAELASKLLSTLDSSSAKGTASQEQNSTYNLSQEVLSAAYSGKATILDSIA